MISAETADILIGYIVMSILGLVVGNFATSIVFRLPRKLKVSNDPPYCDKCREYLHVRDLFPFISWVVNRGKCRFCGADIPASYAVVELSSAILFVVAYFQFGMSEEGILFLALGMFWIIFAAVHSNEGGKFFNEIIIAVFASAVAYRILSDGSIMPFVKGGYATLFTGALIWLLSGLFRKGGRGEFPQYPVIMAMAGVSLGISLVLEYFVLVVIVMLLLSLYNAIVRGVKLRAINPVAEISIFAISSAISTMAILAYHATK